MIGAAVNGTKQYLIQKTNKKLSQTAKAGLVGVRG